MREDEQKTFTVTFPEDYREAELAGQDVEFTATVRELRERRLPVLDDGFAQSMGAFEDVAGLREDIRARLQRNSLDRARHAFADRIIEYAVANATVTPPDLLIEREIDVMIDELKVRLTQQQIEFEEYLKVTERDEAEAARGVARRRRAPGEGAAGAGCHRGQGRRRGRRRRGRGRDREDPSGRVPAIAGSSSTSSPRAAGRTSARRCVARRSSNASSTRWIEAHPKFSDVRHTEDQPVASTSQVEAATDALEEEETDEAEQALEAELAAVGVGGRAAITDSEEEVEA